MTLTVTKPRRRTPFHRPQPLRCTAHTHRGGVASTRKRSPTVRSAPIRSAYTTSTTVDFTAISGLRAGDLIIASFYLGASGRTITPPTGFTLLIGPLTMTGSAAAYRYYVYYKLASGSETTLSFTVSGAATDHTGVIGAWSGVNQTTPFDVTSTSAVGSSTSISAPTLTPVTPNTTLVWMATDWNGVAGSETPTAGFTWQYLVAAQDPMVQDATQTAAAATGAKAVTIATAPWAVAMMALRPA